MAATNLRKDKIDESPPGTVADNESDSNADTCCLGKNFVAISITNRTADVYPYDTSYQPLVNVPIVSGATAFDDKHTGETFILVFNESLYYGPKLGHSLLNPNQLRSNGLGFWDNPFDHNHSLCIETNCGIIIPLSIEGTKLSFRSRVPTTFELNTCH